MTAVHCPSAGIGNRPWERQNAIWTGGRSDSGDCQFPGEQEPPPPPSPYYHHHKGGGGSAVPVTYFYLSSLSNCPKCHSDATRADSDGQRVDRRGQRPAATAVSLGARPPIRRSPNSVIRSRVGGPPNSVRRSRNTSRRRPSVATAHRSRCYGTTVLECHGPERRNGHPRSLDGSCSGWHAITGRRSGQSAPSVRPGRDVGDGGGGQEKRTVPTGTTPLAPQRYTTLPHDERL